MARASKDSPNIGINVSSDILEEFQVGCAVLVEAGQNEEGNKSLFYTTGNLSMKTSMNGKF